MTMKALSTRNDAPEKASRPFDMDRDGFVLAEGAAMYVLESEEHAKKPAALTSYGELVGFGNSSDAGHITAPDAEGRGAGRSMRWALRGRRLNPRHRLRQRPRHLNPPGRQGRGRRRARRSSETTPASPPGQAPDVLDQVHARAHPGRLRRGRDDRLPPRRREGIVAPTINLDQIDPECDGIDLVPNTARQMKVRYAMNNTFGFGGHNVTLVCTAYRP
jgi:3-oxoacyl-[acyl-carrier-protein] synthase II